MEKIEFPQGSVAADSFRKLRALMPWDSLVIPIDPSSGYPAFGMDMTYLFSQFKPNSVMSTVMAAHNAREPLKNAPQQRIDALLNSEKSKEAVMKLNNIAASLSARMEISTGNTPEGTERANVRRKTVYLIFKRLLTDLRELQITQQAYNRNHHATPSPAFEKMRTSINVSGSLPENKNKNLEEIPVSSNMENSVNIDSKPEYLLSTTNQNLPGTSDLLKTTSEKEERAQVDANITSEESRKQLAEEAASVTSMPPGEPIETPVKTVNQSSRLKKRKLQKDISELKIFLEKLKKRNNAV